MNGCNVIDSGDLSIRYIELSTEFCFELNISFLAAEREFAKTFIFNRRQNIAFRLIYHQLNHVHSNAFAIAQLYLFIGGAGGINKSRVIEALVALFASKSVLQK